MKHLTIIFSMFFSLTATAQYTKQNDISRTYEWAYDGHTFSSTLEFRKSDYSYYGGLSKSLPFQDYATEHNSHPYLLEIAKVLDENAKRYGYTGYELVEYLTAFVQQAIPYKKDPFWGWFEYPRFPIETLVERGGDCEDQAALLAALLNVFKFDAILVQLPGHMGVAFSCTNCDGRYYYKDGKKYYFIESTGSSNIGDMSREYWDADAQLLALATPTKFFQREKKNPPRTSPPYVNNSGNNNVEYRRNWRGYAEGNNNNSSQQINNYNNNTTTLTVNGTTYHVQGGSNVSIIVRGSTVIINTR